MMTSKTFRKISELESDVQKGLRKYEEKCEEVLDLKKIHELELQTIRNATENWRTRTIPKGPSTPKSQTYPKPVLELLLNNTQVPNYWVLGPLGEAYYSGLNYYWVLGPLREAYYRGLN